MADDIERLTAQFDADVSKFEKAMTRMGVSFDKQSQAIGRQNSALIAKMNSSWDGLKGPTRAVLAVGAVTGVAAGLAELVDKALDAAKSIGITAQQAGIGVERLQELRYASSQTGGSFETMDAALVTFNKNFGQFLNDHTGKAAKAFEELGLDKAVNSGAVRDAGAAFDFIIDKIRQYGNTSQQVGFLARAFGQELGPKMIGFVQAGGEAIARLEAQAKSLGIVMSESTIKNAAEAKDKLDALFSVMKVQGVAAIAALAPKITELTQNIIEQLPKLVTWAEHWAAVLGLIKQTPRVELQYQVDSLNSDIAGLSEEKKGNQQSGFWGWWKRTFGLSDQEYDTLIADNRAKAKALTAALAKLPKDAALPTAPPAKPEPKLKIGTTPEAAAAAAKAAEALRERQQQALDTRNVDAATADAALLAARDQLNVQLLKGSADYYAAVIKMIEDEKNAKIAEIDAEEKKQLDSLAKLKLGQAAYAAAVKQIRATADTKRETAETDAQGREDEAGAPGLMVGARVSSGEEIQRLKDHAAALGLDAAAMAKLQFIQEQLNAAREKGITLSAQDMAKLNQEGNAIAAQAQKAHEAEIASQNDIQVTDDLREGLSNMALTGLKGFTGLKAAAGDFLQSLAKTIAQLYILNPLLKGLFGEKGTTGDGLLGAPLANATGAASAATPATPETGGLIGDVWNWLFGGTSGAVPSTTATNTGSMPGSSSVGVMTVTAGMVTVSGGTSAGGSDDGLGGLAGLIGKLLGGGGDFFGSSTVAGGLGDLETTLPTFADGGVMTSRGRMSLRRFADGGTTSSPQLAMFGEAGPEAFVPLKSGAIPVSLLTPRAKPASPPINVVTNFNIDARYATESTADLIESRVRAAAPVIASQAVRQARAEFPENFRKTFRDKG